MCHHSKLAQIFLLSVLPLSLALPGPESQYHDGGHAGGAQYHDGGHPGGAQYHDGGHAGQLARRLEQFNIIFKIMSTHFKINTTSRWV